MKRIYLDHAAATPMDQRVTEAMDPFWYENFGNAGGLYREGRTAKEAMDAARKEIAHTIGARPDEIIFTSGGTESDNLAIFGTARRATASSTSDVEFPKTSDVFPAIARPHIITTRFEHRAVLGPCELLEKGGFEVTYLEVGNNGIINPEDVKKALRSETILVSIMYANNEIGTIQPIAKIGKIIKEFNENNAAGRSHKTYFHTDACQAAGYLDLNVQNLGVDLMSINGSKIYGPKGIGFLYKRSGVKIKPQMVGGGQELRMRSGTENIPLIAGLSKALKIAQEEKNTESKRLTELRDYFISEMMRRVPRVVLNGDAERRLPNNINVSILGIEGEALLLYLDSLGIACGTGSACTSESLEPSHVILALGKPYEFAHSSIRFTLGRSTKKEDLEYVLEKLPGVVEWLRVVSPITIKTAHNYFRKTEQLCPEK